MGLSILVTNLHVAQGSGSEAVVELLADGLRRAGHKPMLYAPTLGPQAIRMRGRGHIVVDRIAALPARPDVMHLQHLTPALMALAAFPQVPAVFACHSGLFEVEAPRLHPQIRFWSAVDEHCRDRCLSRGIPAERLSVILNAVDILRFQARTTLPLRPARGLLLTKTHGQRDIVHAACAEAGIVLTELGPATGRVVPNLEDELPKHDIVFATARMALEAAVVGCAVVVGDGRGFAGTLTSANLDAWRRLNFGAALLARPMSLEGLRDAIAAYDSNDAAIVSATLRNQATAEAYASAHIDLYRAALAEPPPDQASVTAATAEWLEDLLPSAAPRAWREVVREIHGLAAMPTEQMLRASEQTIGGILTTTAARQEAALAQFRTESTALQESLVRDAAKRVAGEQEAAMARMVEATEARLLQAITALPGPRLEPVLRAIWRRVIPLSLRRPLHSLRRRFLSGLKTD